MQNVSTLLEQIFKNEDINVKLWESLNYILQKNNEEIINFCNIIISKINSGNKPEILLALNLVDFTVDYGKQLLWEKIDSKDFLSCIIDKIQNNKDPDLQSVCLYLINKLAEKFKNYPSLQNCVKLQHNLKRNRVNFPQSLKHSYMDILNKSKTNISNNNINNNINNINHINIHNTHFVPNAHINLNKEFKNRKYSGIPIKPENYINNINLDLKPDNFHEKYRRLISKINEIIQLIQEINVLIYKNFNCKYNEKLKNLCEKLTSDKNKLINCINNPKLLDEQKLMSISLTLVEDINMTLDRYEKSKKGENPGPFSTSFLRDNNPYINKPKINICKTFIPEFNHNHNMNELDLGESLQTVDLNDENHIMENSLNIMFGKIEKSEVVDLNKNQNQHSSKNINYFNEMSQYSNSEDVFNHNRNLSDKNLSFLNNSNVMIIGNRIINNNINNSNNNFNNNSLANKNFLGNIGNKGIYNNFLLNNNNIQSNNNISNKNNLYNTQIIPKNHILNRNNVINRNNINNGNNINNRNNNQQINNYNDKYNNTSKTQFYSNHINLNNKI